MRILTDQEGAFLTSEAVSLAYRYLYASRIPTVVMEKVLLEAWLLGRINQSRVTGETLRYLATRQCEMHLASMGVGADFHHKFISDCFN
jgi:hypothetical protein